ncbi:hypothetical protein [Motilimonas eburnea]|uniref:hypothetical protein n=1 Tax=Motilimonas eburnea TaxID=1737488 RepID=UPI001E29223A|nr:hypothetical protein [Motilimonas eburnea]MCE2572594.1 hypothetical protein [Motilimonas eburnea]
MKKRILIIGDGNHQFNKHLSKYLRRDLEYSVDVISFYKVEDGKTFFDKIYDIKPPRLTFNTFKVLYILIRVYAFLLTKSHRYEYISLQFLRPLYSKLLSLPFLRHKKIIASVWGSDLLGQHLTEKEKINIFSKVGKITCATSFIKNKIQALTETEVNIIKYGLEPLEAIRKDTSTKSEAKRYFDICDKKITIAVGYNGARRQRHLEFIHALLDTLPEYDFKKLFFLFPVTYGRDELYLEKLKSVCEGNGINSLFFDEFMTEKEVAKLRICSDFFINIQPTDAISGALQEHIMAGSKVICGSWLNYTTLTDQGINITFVDSIDSIAGYLFDVESLKERDDKNAKVIYRISSWENCIKGWGDVFGE